LQGTSEFAAARSEIDRARLAIACGAAAVAGALMIESLVSATAGAALCAILVAALANFHLWSASRGWSVHGVFLALALVSLAGMLGIVMPTRSVPSAAWPLLAGAPLLLAVELGARQLGLGGTALMLKPTPLQLSVAPAGVPLGLLAYSILRPPPLGHGGTVAVAVAALLVLAITEELLFRGLLQPVLCGFYGATGVAMTAAFSAVVALAAHSPAYGVLAGASAVGFGMVARRTGSVAGTSAARAILFIGLLVVWPRVLG
jgi:membrane protease YdiL (CAAX protease family)